MNNQMMSLEHLQAYRPLSRHSVCKKMSYLTLAKCFLFSVTFCFLWTSFCFLSLRILCILVNGEFDIDHNKHAYMYCITFMYHTHWPRIWFLGMVWPQMFSLWNFPAFYQDILFYCNDHKFVMENKQKAKQFLLSLVSQLRSGYQNSGYMQNITSIFLINHNQLWS